MLERALPDFLCIGAQKSGTSWLYEHLNRHPDIWMPPVKELHYFDRHLRTRSTGLLGRISRKELWAMLARVKNDLVERDLKGLRWNLKYYLGERTDEWYASLFEPGRDRITGEITPAYSLLDEEDVAAIHALLPRAKIIFLMRDPIDRVWSQARMDLARRMNRPIASVQEEELLAFFGSQACSLRSDYLRTLQNWEACFSEEQMFIGYMEDVSRHPERLLLDIFDFLGVSASPTHISSTAQRKVHAGPGVELSMEMQRHLASQYVEQLRILDERFGGYVSDWRERAEHLLSPKDCGEEPISSQRDGAA